MGPKTFKRIIDHVFQTRKEYVGMWGARWDYPDYGGLPKSISYRLSPEAVDAMQNVIQIVYSRKRDFARAYRKELRELGEPGKY
jgi:hypothetical protein